MNDTKLNHRLVRTCKECGAENGIDEKICYSCGTLLSPQRGGATNTLARGDANRLERLAPPPAERESYFPVGKTVKFKLRERDDPMVYSLDGGSMLMGRRDPDASFTPDIDFYSFAAMMLGVSRKHAVLHRISDQLMVEDLGSRNGTFIDGVPLKAYEKYPLYSGAELRLGDLHFKVLF